MLRLSKLFATFLLVVVASSSAWAQKVEIRFWIDGICGMCEERIETALLNTKGVWTADWNEKTHEVVVVYNPKKTTELALHQAVAAVGHDTKKVKAPEAAYAKLHGCCKYRSKTVRDQHS
jgi:mercuric ion binding protein